MNMFVFLCEFFEGGCVMDQLGVLLLGLYIFKFELNVWNLKVGDFV